MVGFEYNPKEGTMTKKWEDVTRKDKMVALVAIGCLACAIAVVLLAIIFSSPAMCPLKGKEWIPLDSRDCQSTLAALKGHRPAMPAAWLAQKKEAERFARWVSLRLVYGDLVPFEQPAQQVGKRILLASLPPADVGR
jgi:hypothetical protein